MTHPNLCISRVDNPSSHGWLVRISRNGERIIKFFSDTTYSGKRLAQQAAKNYRDQTLSRLQREGKQPRAKKLVARQRRNKTGVIGVCKVNRPRANGTAAEYYLVSWRPQPGVQRATSISIDKYGPELALKKAIALRNRMLMRRYGSGVFRKLTALRDARAPETPYSPPTPESAKE
jgi:hypothetical protein